MENMLALILQQNDDFFGTFFVGSYFLACCCSGILIVLYIAGLWKVFTKAGKPGWAAIVPIYNIWVLLEIVGRPGWWLILYFIPFVNVVVQILVTLELAKSYGRGIGYAIGLLLLPFIFYLMLGFGEDQYQGPAAGKVF
jgi:hypothetical protein